MMAPKLMHSGILKPVGNMVVSNTPKRVLHQYCNTLVIGSSSGFLLPLDDDDDAADDTFYLFLSICLDTLSRLSLFGQLCFWSNQHKTLIF